MLKNDEPEFVVGPSGKIQITKTGLCNRFPALRGKNVTEMSAKQFDELNLPQDWNRDWLQELENEAAKLPELKRVGEE